MKKTVILGAAWGDEGKGRIVHSFSKSYDWVVRFSGGANAGHTIWRDGVKYVHNLLPSFDWRVSGLRCYLGNGMVIDLEQLYIEVEKLYKVGGVELCSRVYVDLEAFIVECRHKEIDKEKNKWVGSTNRGIGPAYMSKVGREGVRVYNVEDSEVVKKLKLMGVKFVYLMEVLEEIERSSVIFEGAQGVMLDLGCGIYPYVSNGMSTVAGVYENGFHFKLDEVYGVGKCYTTKVGSGSFPSEIFGDEMERIRERGGEYGATTGRARRIGWIDLAAMKYACRRGGINKLILTKFDILAGMDKVKICVDYKGGVRGVNSFVDAECIYKEVRGWGEDVEGYKEFIEEVEKVVGVRVEYISNGIGEENLIKV